MSLAPVGLPSVLPADVLAELKETAKMLCAPGASQQVCREASERQRERERDRQTERESECVCVRE